MISEVLTTGKELLIGRVINSNAYWLAKKLTLMGLEVKRITVVDDKPGEIAGAIKEAVKRGTDFLFVTGGLGPTEDDRTSEALSQAMNTVYESNIEALEMIREKCIENKLELNKERLKMSFIPRGAKPIYNSLGIAPGIKAKIGKTNVYCLPGVPREMINMFINKVYPEVHGEVKGVHYIEESYLITGLHESDLSPVISKIKHLFPELYVKTRFLSDKRVELLLSFLGEDVERGKNRISEALEKIKKLRGQKRFNTVSFHFS